VIGPIEIRRRAKTTASPWHLPNSSWPGLSRPPIAAQIRGFFLPSLVPGTSSGMTGKETNRLIWCWASP